MKKSTADGRRWTQITDPENLRPSASICGSILPLVLLLGCALLQRQPEVTSHETVNAVGQTNVVTQTNWIYAVNAGLTNGLALGRDLARDAGGPWGNLAAVVFGGAATIFAGIARRKNAQMKREAAQAALVPTLITAIESAPSNEPVKREIQKLAKATGLEDRLNATVKRLTD